MPCCTTRPERTPTQRPSRRPSCGACTPTTPTVWVGATSATTCLVDKYGQIFEGRYGRLDRPVTGAHALGFNTDTFGVSVLGSHDSATPTAAALDAVSTAMAWRLRMFYVGAADRTTLVSADSGSRDPEGTSVSLPTIIGHRDVNTTACPGNHLWTRQASLRTATAAHRTTPRARSTSGGSHPVAPADGSAPSHVEGPCRRSATARSSMAAACVAGGAMHELSDVFSTYYEDLGGPASWGRPVSSSIPVGGGQRIDTVGGFTLTWAPNIGTRRTNGAPRTYWLSRGGPTGDLGFPRTEMSMPTSAGYVQDFTQGAVYYKYAEGAHAVTGPLLTYFRAVGGPASPYGYPSADALRVSTG
ncbi:N-acetylmuramoyl-L-alanine amidase [Knoellia sp. S7-12]|uniref:N-acetylmuramoyl-L-alanine amidase n=1 Tax=Knoellia sp. S7-12 TaxID=3126698 RepID=UPI0033699708